jgi:hypothetical protein
VPLDRNLLHAPTVALVRIIMCISSALRPGQIKEKRKNLHFRSARRLIELNKILRWRIQWIRRSFCSSRSVKLSWKSIFSISAPTEQPGMAVVLVGLVLHVQLKTVQWSVGDVSSGF